MPKALVPGVGKRAEETAAAAETLTITFRGQSLTFADKNLPFSERAAVRMATGGLPLEAYWNGGLTVEADSVMLLWWLARRANGEPNLRLSEVEADWPQPFDFTLVKISRTVPDGEADDPEA